MSKCEYPNQIEKAFTASTIKWALYSCVHNIPLHTLVQIQKCNCVHRRIIMNACVHKSTQWVLLDCQFVYTRVNMALFCAVDWTFYVTIFEKISWLCMEYMYTQVKMHLKSGILAFIWNCKMQGSQSFRGFALWTPPGLCPGPTGGTITYPSESHEYCQFWTWIVKKNSWILIF